VTGYQPLLVCRGACGNGKPMREAWARHAYHGTGPAGPRVNVFYACASCGTLRVWGSINPAAQPPYGAGDRL
jgi:hypothetical protein